MDTKIFRTFLVVARCLNFREAAEELNYAQSSVSDHIRTLEQELGIKVFERIGRKIYLNEYGKKLIPFAERFVQDESELLAELRGDGRISGKIRIGAGETLSAYWLPPILKEYHLLYPEVEISLEMDDCLKFPKRLADNHVDVAFSMHDESENNLILQYPLFEGDTVLIASPESPLIASRIIKAEDFSSIPLIQTEEGCCYRKELDTFLEQHHVAVNVILELTSIEAIKHCVKSGLGVSLLPRMAVEKELSSGELIPLFLADCEIPFQVNMIFHSQKWISPPLAAFCDHVLKNHGPIQ